MYSTSSPRGGKGGCRGPAISRHISWPSWLYAVSPPSRSSQATWEETSLWLGWKKSAQKPCFENLIPDLLVLGHLVSQVHNCHHVSHVHSTTGSTPVGNVLQRRFPVETLGQLCFLYVSRPHSEEVMGRAVSGAVEGHRLSLNSSPPQLSLKSSSTEHPSPAWKRTNLYGTVGTKNLPSH